MSLDMNLASERVCYVHCNFCNTILAVSVPSSSLFTIVTVRCGHCGNLLSVNMGMGPPNSLPPPTPNSLPPPPLLKQIASLEDHSNVGKSKEHHGSSSSKPNKIPSFENVNNHRDLPIRSPPIRPPEKRQRVPSAYNRFIKEEIQRIKAGNPDISHREAFSTAAKNWAHFPHIHFGLKLDGTKNKQAKLDQGDIINNQATQKANGFY